MEASMRVFILAAVIAVVVATGWSFALNAFQETAGQVPAQSVRLDQQEAVNIYGREG
jgi:uncharacterized protein involved in response to NO